MLSNIISSIKLHSPDRKVLLTAERVHPGIVKRCLALKCGRVANLHVHPMRDWLSQLAAPLFQGKTYLAGSRQFWFMFNLLHSSREELPYLREATEFSHISSLVLASLEDMTLNDVSKKQFEDLPNKTKFDDLLTIKAIYEQKKKDQSFFDFTDVVHALLHSKQEAEGVYLLEHPLRLREKTLVENMGIVRIPLEVSDTRSYQFTGYKVDTAYQEALQTIRNISTDMEKASLPVKIGVCVPDYAQTYRIFKQSLEEIGLPDMVHFIRGEPVFATSPGKLWMYFAEWVENSFSVYRLIRVLESPGFQRGDVEPNVFHNAVKAIRRSGIALHDKRFKSTLAKFLSSAGDEDEEAIAESKETDTAALALADEFHRVHVGATPTDRLKELTGLFITRARIRSESDAMAVARIESIVETLNDSGVPAHEGLSLQDLVSTISVTLESQYVGRKLPDFTRPIVGELSDLVYSEWDVLYVLGMNEKGLPRPIHQNPLLLDHEKQLLLSAIPNAHFSLREERLVEGQAEFQRLLQQTTQKVVMSAPLKDLATGRELLSSRYLLQEWNCFFKTNLDYQLLSSELGKNPLSQNNHIASNPEEAISRYDLGVAASLRHVDDNVKDPLLSSEFPFAKSVAAFRQARRTASSFDEYWGLIKRRSTDTLPVLSASRISTWTRCPHQYFLKYDLKLNEEEDFDAHALEWLDAMHYGSFLHELYHRFFIKLREKKGEGFTKVVVGDRKILDKEFAQLLEEYQSEYPMNSAPHVVTTVRRLEDDIAGFFDRELLVSRKRMFAELSFAMSFREKRKGLLKRDEPAEIRLPNGETARVRGSIDRVDIQENGRVLLIDYKTGKSVAPVEGQPFLGGKLIQAGLYSEIVNQIDATISDPQFMYYYVTGKSDYFEHTIDYPEVRDHFLKFLEAIIGELKSGNSVPRASSERDDPVCGFCDYFNVCMNRRKWLADLLKQKDKRHSRFEQIAKEELL